VTLKKIPMTREGLEKLIEELKCLKRDERPRVIKAIEEARGHGDLSENADYDAAKERQAFVWKRIGELENMIATAEVIDSARFSTDKVVFGACVELSSDDGKEITYRLVGDHESDVKAGKISVNSPIAKALIGKKCGDYVEVITPSGKRGFEILKISFQ
jgi:transcription elongation factor GreA